MRKIIWPKGWDLADPLPEGVTIRDLRAMLKNARPVNPTHEGIKPNDAPSNSSANGEDRTTNGASGFNFTGKRPDVAMAEWKSSKTFMAAYVPLNQIIKPILSPKGVYTLTARTHGGKTALLVTMALAVAVGSQTMLGMKVEQGRVAYLTCENPDGLRMRLRVACYHFGIEPDSIASTFLVQESFANPQQMLAAAQHHAGSGEFKLIILDTLQAFFTGDDSDSNAQVMQLLRGVRPLTYIAGGPCVLIAAHPTKNASDQDLIPYGGGAILNEIDGNLCLYEDENGDTPSFTGAANYAVWILSLSISKSN